MAEQEVKDEEEKRDRQKTDNGLCHYIGFSFDGGLNPGASEFLLQIIGEIEINRSFEWHLLRRR